MFSFFLTQQDLDRKAHDFCCCCCFKTKIMSLFLCLLMAGGIFIKQSFFALMWLVDGSQSLDCFSRFQLYVGLLSKSVKPGRWEGSPITVNIRPKTKFELLLRRNFAREHCVVSVFSMQGHHIKLYEKENQVSTFLQDKETRRASLQISSPDKSPSLPKILIYDI